jgi:hypothetical protein
MISTGMTSLALMFDCHLLCFGIKVLKDFCAAIGKASLRVLGGPIEGIILLLLLASLACTS